MVFLWSNFGSKMQWGLFKIGGNQHVSACFNFSFQKKSASLQNEAEKKPIDPKNGYV